MNKNEPIYALDFDGVICDSCIETSIAGWKAACRLWQDMPSDTPKALLDDFRTLRPALETGYEAILIMRLLYQGLSTEYIRQDYSKILKNLAQQNNLTLTELKHCFATTRDQWITNDRHDWLSVNPLFKGIASKLARLHNKTWYIVTTKQERFVQERLQAHQLSINEHAIYGMDRQINKQQVLQQLIQQHPNQPLIFIEDRLPTLIGISQNTALNNIQLQLALWGYNTQKDKDNHQNYPIQALQLKDFLSPSFSGR